MLIAMHAFASTIFEGWTFFVCSIALFLCTWSEVFSYRITLQVFLNKVLIYKNKVFFVQKKTALRSIGSSGLLISRPDCGDKGRWWEHLTFPWAKSLQHTWLTWICLCPKCPHPGCSTVSRKISTHPQFDPLLDFLIKEMMFV